MIMFAGVLGHCTNLQDALIPSLVVICCTAVVLMRLITVGQKMHSWVALQGLHVGNWQCSKKSGISRQDDDVPCNARDCNCLYEYLKVGLAMVL